MSKEPLPPGSSIIGWPDLYGAFNGTYLGDGYWLDLKHVEVFYNPSLALHVLKSSKVKVL